MATEQQETQTETRTFQVSIRYWPEGRDPSAVDVFLAVQDSVGSGGRLAGCEVEEINCAYVGGPA